MVFYLSASIVFSLLSIGLFLILGSGFAVVDFASGFAMCITGIFSLLGFVFFHKWGAGIVGLVLYLLFCWYMSRLRVRKKRLANSVFFSIAILNAFIGFLIMVLSVR